MPYLQTEPKLPFSGRSPRARHRSMQGAESVQGKRGEQTRRYCELLQTCGPLSDHAAALRLSLPLSSVNSIRNDLGNQVQAVGTTLSCFGRKVNTWGWRA